VSRCGVVCGAAHVPLRVRFSIGCFNENIGALRLLRSADCAVYNPAADNLKEMTI
jgi:hypothetical protein